MRRYIIRDGITDQWFTGFGKKYDWDQCEWLEDFVWNIPTFSFEEGEKIVAELNELFKSEPKNDFQLIPVKEIHNGPVYKVGNV